MTRMEQASGETERIRPAGQQAGSGYTFVLNPQQPAAATASCYRETPIASAVGLPEWEKDSVPEAIRQMIHLYEYKDSSFRAKCWNFYRQGKFMEHYTDEAPWDGEFQHYFPTYHDLNVPQLRGYFTWRTHARRGDWRNISTSLAYIYVYELLNGIGADSVTDSLAKMQAFEAGFLNAGYGDEGLRKNLHRWMLELAIVHMLPAETVLPLIPISLIENDEKLNILHAPENRTDEEVFQAMNHFMNRDLRESPVFLNDNHRGMHLFAEVWRTALAKSRYLGEDLFANCFSPKKVYPWYPLANAVYWELRTLPNFTFEVDAARRYIFQDGSWFEEKYEELFFDKKRFYQLVHTADGMFRRYLKTGRYLKENVSGAWAALYAEMVIEADRKAQEEAARPKITIDLSGLDQIRRDALVTRDSLLTADEMEVADASLGADAFQRPTNETAFPGADASKRLIGADTSERLVAETASQPSVPETAPDFPSSDLPFDTLILQTLLQGNDATPLIRANRLMPSIVADRLNEAFYDDIGDNIIELDGDRLTLVEDYREDLCSLITDHCSLITNH